MSYLDPAIYGYALQDSYQFGSDESHQVIPVAVGRARYRLRNPLAVSRLTIQYTWTDDIFAQFRDFWHTTINHGTDWFDVDLQFGDQVLTYSAHATGPYTATTVQAGNWAITIPIEVKRVPV